MKKKINFEINNSVFFSFGVYGQWIHSKRLTTFCLNNCDWLVFFHPRVFFSLLICSNNFFGGSYIYTIIFSPKRYRFLYLFSRWIAEADIIASAHRYIYLYTIFMKHNRSNIINWYDTVETKFHLRRRDNINSVVGMSVSFFSTEFPFSFIDLAVINRSTCGFIITVRDESMTKKALGIEDAG